MHADNVSVAALGGLSGYRVLLPQKGLELSTVPRMPKMKPDSE